MRSVPRSLKEGLSSLSWFRDWFGDFFQREHAGLRDPRGHRQRHKRTAFETRLKLLCGALLLPGTVAVLVLMLEEKSSAYAIASLTGALLLLGLFLSSVL